MSSSIWARSLANGLGRVTCPLNTDNIIVGAGISGLTTAYLLGRNGHRPIVIDAGEPGSGETGRTSAHLTSVIDDRFLEMERIHGEEGSRLAFQSHSRAIDLIEDISNRHNISCEFSRLDGYLFSTEENGKEYLQKELQAAKRAGHERAELLEHSPLHGIDMYPCIRFPNQARFNPGLYLAGLLQEVQSMGIPVYTGTRVLSWEKREKIVLKTEADIELLCDKVVFATNDPYVRFSYYLKHAPYRSYVSVFRVPDQITEDGLYWDTEDAYHYIRFAGDTEGVGRVMIVGGEDHKTGQDPHPTEKWQALESWARSRFPFLGSKISEWSGQILETMDGLAFIGADPGGEGRVYLVSGDSGMGLTHGTLGGLILADLLEGKENPWADLYDPGRFRWKAADEFAKENLNVVGQYAHWLVPSRSREQNGDGRGRVVQRGFKKVASISRQGKRCELSAVCTHLGGLVTWNEAEGTWDCECHGSRFASDGAVLCGPAVTPLTEAS